MKRFGWLAMAAAICALIAWAVLTGGRDDPVSSETVNATVPAAPAAYIEDSLCATCHVQQYNDWLDSHHDRAMEEANGETVLGDFDGAAFSHFGVESRFLRRDGGFFVHTDGPDGTLEDFQVQYTFGVEPLQQYLIPLPGGRLQALSIAWNTVVGEWFHLYPDEVIPAGDPLHWTGRLQNWNSGCAECHSTNLDINYDQARRTYRTTWSAIDVGCQGCHGPGQRHAEWAGGRQSALGNVAEDFGLSVRYGDSIREIEACATCHSRRSPISPDRSPGAAFLDSFSPVLLEPELYHADGQILGEVFEYGSFLQSRMFAEGVRCTDCHNPHSLQLQVLGNAVCEQCHHPEAPQNRFPTLTAKNYNSPDHHFHPEGSAGAQCVSCHMAERTYMVVDPRRDHSFRIPRPDVSAAIGSPDACTLCHTDQSQEWAARTIADWYGPERRRELHYGEVLAAGREGRPTALDALIELVRDEEQPAIVRASALRLLIPYGAGAVGSISAVFDDPEPLVRMAATAGLGALPPTERLRIGARLLRDPVRSVRIQAAREIAPDAANLSRNVRTAFDAARAEYEAGESVRPDSPGSHFNLGNFHTAIGEHGRAVGDYRMSLSLDPSFLPASRNLAVLLSQLGRNIEAEDTLRNALAFTADAGDAYYSLGLLLAEEERLEEAVQALERAAGLLPENARIHYNHGLALQRLDRRPEAEAALLRADSLAPGTPAFLMALAILYAQEGRWAEALPWAERLVELDGDTDARNLLDRIRSELLR